MAAVVPSDWKTGKGLRDVFSVSSPCHLLQPAMPSRRRQEAQTETRCLRETRLQSPRKPGGQDAQARAHERVIWFITDYRSQSGDVVQRDQDVGDRSRPGLSRREFSLIFYGRSAGFVRSSRKTGRPSGVISLCPGTRTRSRNRRTLPAGTGAHVLPAGQAVRAALLAVLGCRRAGRVSRVTCV